MSEEILKALMELFALIVKQDGGILANEREYVYDFLRKQLTKESVEEYFALFDELAGPVTGKKTLTVSTAPSVRDSVKILGICKKINKTLNQEQKVVVLMRLYELINSDRQFTSQRMNIINTVAEVFRISSAEFEAIEQFVKIDNPEKISNPSILVLCPENERCILKGKMLSGYKGTYISVLRISSVELFFLKYISEDQLYLNGLPIRPESVYTFAKGGSVKSPHGQAIYYSDINSCFLSDNNLHKISFVAENISLRFGESQTAVDNVSFSVEEGRLVGILGASGSGKTTLLNILSGIQKPNSGTIHINGIDIDKDRKKIEGVLGYVPQDDLLIEDLTVFENLYFAACQCFGDKNKKEITYLVDQTLASLGLSDKRELKVGSAFNKVISGGQRKRLNIALELIREPEIMFIDEPTSGLSSRDSENLMSLIRELTLKGKLIFTVIHQPSSEIFKMFDKIIILDQGGSLAYYGNPVEAVVYFKKIDSRLNSHLGECPSCGNVNPETIFDIIETQVVDEFGKYTDKRKVKPEEWASLFRLHFPFSAISEIKDPPHLNLKRPSRFKQFRIYLLRDVLGKLANHQYMLLTILEAPILAFILSAIIRYIPDPDSTTYIFAENENIPVYIFMSIIVALFLGLTISAEEIFRDRKILRRERFLNLSRSSYLLSKIGILAFISAVQMLIFVIVGNNILGIREMNFQYWLALFTTAFCANMIGLNISSAFNSAITIYIVIPLVIIPMMILSGAMFAFDKLNRKIGNVENVPFIAEIMPTRWTYEALMVSQFKDNSYSRIVYDRAGNTFFDLQKKISEADFNKVHRIPLLRDALNQSLKEYKGSNTNENPVSQVVIHEKQFTRLKLLSNELNEFPARYNIPRFRNLAYLTPESFNNSVADSVLSYLDMCDRLFSKLSNTTSDKIDMFYTRNDKKLKELENSFYNYRLKEIVTKPYERKKILVYNNRIIQNTDPVYLEPESKSSFNFRTHFFAPSKNIFGIRVDTFTFNISLILLSTIIFYLTLYFDLPGKVVRFSENLHFRK
jgi:ABC-type multidrug transport system ATPase subunit